MPPLEVARIVLLITHLVGPAALIGPFFFQVRSRHAPALRLMLTGAITQALTGDALIATRRFQGVDVDETTCLAFADVIDAVVWT